MGPSRLYNPTVETADAKPTQHSRGQQALASLCLLVLLAEVPGYQLVPASAFLAVALAPILTKTNQDRHGLALTWAGFAAVISGITIALLPSGNSEPLQPSVMLAVGIWIATFPAVVALGRWALDQVRSKRLGLSLAMIGAIGSSLLNSTEAQWKGTLGIYVIILALLAAPSLFIVRALLLATAAVVSSMNDARSMTLVAVISIVLIFAFPMGNSTSSTATRRVILTTILAAGVALWAMTTGLLGAAVQQRTLNQLSNPARFIWGARVEWASTLYLAERRPLGFGLGAALPQEDITGGIAAVRSIGGDWTSPYFRDNVFAERVDLHSTLANLWYHAGLGGVALAFVIALLLVRGLAATCSDMSSPTSAAGIFSILMALWDLMFSPMANNDRIIIGLIFACVALTPLPKGAGAVPERPCPEP